MLVGLSTIRTFRQFAAQCGKIVVCLFLLTLVSACGSSSQPSAPQNDSTKPDPRADFTYSTNEEAPAVINFESLSTASAFEIITEPKFGRVTLQPDNKRFVYLPQKDFFGYDRIVYSDGDTDTIISIEVKNINDAPFLINDLRRVIEQGTLYSETLNAGDADNDALVFTAANLPAWLSLNRDTGMLTGAPGQQDVGLVERISFKVTDPSGEFAEILDVTLEVLDVNDAPTINPDQFPAAMDARSDILVNVFPDDPDGEFVTVNVEANDFLDLVVQGGSIRVTAKNVTDVTEVNLVVLATDERGNVAREIIPLTLHPLTASGKGRTIRGRQSGPGVHLVVLGDGYRADQQTLFDKHVDDFIANMARDDGVSVHFDAWNVHTIEAISTDSGIDDDFSFDFRDTVFNAGYFCNSIQRLVCADTLKVIETVFLEYPDYHQIVLLVNDQRYGGSGGQVAISSAAFPEIALHELGHSFAGLADEYVDEQIPKLNPNAYVEGRYANISTINDRARVPWSHWLQRSDNTEVGIFEGAFYQAEGFYRSTFDSRMRSYGKPFGPVNSEQWALRVYDKAQAVVELSPVVTTLTIPSGQTQLFSVVPILDRSIQRIQWSLNGSVVPGAINNTNWAPALPVGTHTLTVRVDDISGQIVKSTPHSGQFVWTWEIERQ